MSVRSRSWRWRPRPEILLLAVALAVCVLLAEVVLRLHYAVTYTGTLDDLHGASPPPGSDSRLGDLLELSSHPRVVYRFKPGLVDVRLNGAHVSTNSLGFRERRQPRAKEPGTVRVIGIGDSVMFGQGVEESERYMDVLEEILHRRFPAARWESVTLAAPGYNLVTALAALEHYGLDYEPDLVIYGFVPNDFCLPNFVGRRRSVWGRESFIRYYLAGGGAAGSSLVGRHRVMLERPRASSGVARRRDPALFFDTYCSPANVEPEYRALVGEESFQAALEELADLGRRRDIPVVLFNYGRTGRISSLTIPDDMIVIDLHRAYRDYLEKNGFASDLESDLVLSAADPHPSPRAHRLIAGRLARRLQDAGVISRLLARSSP